MQIDALLNHTKRSGYGKWNGEAIGPLLLAWDYLLSDEQKKEVAAFFNVAHPATRDAVRDAALEYMNQGCRKGRWRWEPSD